MRKLYGCTTYRLLQVQSFAILKDIHIDTFQVSLNPTVKIVLKYTNCDVLPKIIQRKCLKFKDKSSHVFRSVI